VRAILVHIFTENPEGASVAQLGSVREAREILEDAGVEVELDESSGDPADIILDIADEVDADVVGLGGRKRSPAGKALFGSVTQSVILNTDRPVLVSGTAEKE
jgi:nucleotide-binding universal stress UspA family protein